MEDYLNIFIKDEFIHWHNQAHKDTPINENQLREVVLSNCDLIMKRAYLLSCKHERENVSYFKNLLLELKLIIF
jgi:hypothetical protein